MVELSPWSRSGAECFQAQEPRNPKPPKSFISLSRTKPMSYDTEMVSPLGSFSLDLMNNDTYSCETQQFVS